MVYAYLGEFFDGDARRLVCTTHGARYDPVAVRAPIALVRLTIVEQDQKVTIEP